MKKIRKSSKMLSQGYKGFTLIEVILALAVFSLAIGGILGILSKSTGAISQVTERSMATNVLREAVSLVEQEIEIRKSTGSSPITNASGINGLFPMEFTIDGQKVVSGQTGPIGTPYYQVKFTSGKNIGTSAAGGTLEVIWGAKSRWGDWGDKEKPSLKHVFFLN